MGLSKESLDNDLKKNLDLGLPFFTLFHVQQYERERMIFELRYLRAPEETYQLEKCKATHRQQIDIYSNNVNGVNVPELETDMTDIDWPAYFADPNSALAIYHGDYIKSTLDTLGQLGNGPVEEGHELMELLMYKYWPAQAARLSSIEKFRKEYENAQDFGMKDWPEFTAALAFHIVSGRFDAVYNEIKDTGIEEISGSDIRAWLKVELSKERPEGFQSVQEWSTEEGYAKMTLHIIKSDDWYLVDSFTVSLALYPEIAHGLYTEVDTCALEALMRKINWNISETLQIHSPDNKPVLNDSVTRVVAAMQRLSQSTQGIAARDLLALKYWQQSPLFKEAIPKSAWDLLAALPAKTRGFLPGATAETAVNLLAGRAVPEHVIYPMTVPSRTWLKLVSDPEGDPNGMVVSMEGYGRKELENLVGLLPVNPGDIHTLVSALMNGNLVHATLVNGNEVLLEAPGEGCINIYTRERQRIHANILLDPEWKPPAEALQKWINEELLNTPQADQQQYSYKKKPRGKKL
ncbi:hypothetical protein DCC81_25155 [Chitinophaga parva]|uniref:Uncharacterized protein n=2 Tax=Chitinophaga parva TaxID=2169414 RepID=A0A2T7BBD6_9BACT|nr:hypothetical protein DCC81_25155 [Chitinophaga parva]